MSAPLTIERLPAHALPLADRFYQSQRVKDRCRGHDRVWLARRGGGIVGVARLSPQGGAWLLRGVWVDPAGRRQGVGQALVRAALKGGDGPVWCFALPHLSGWYLSSGFSRVDAPPETLAAMLTAYRRSQPKLRSFRYP